MNWSALKLGKALVTRPDLWWTTIRLVFRLVPNQWWRRGPWPRREYLEYRTKAVYGLALDDMDPQEFVRYVEWCKAFPAPVR